MLLIDKTQATDIIVTVGERVSTFSTLVFMFQNYQTETILTFAKGATTSITIPMYGTSGTTGASGPSIDNERYKQFTLKSTETSGFTDGFWDYFVYGTTATLGFTGSSHYIDCTGMTELEKGKAYIQPSGETCSTYGPTGDTIVVYEG